MIDNGETAVEEISMYICGSESTQECTQRASPPKSGQNLNNQAEEMGFVGGKKRQRKGLPWWCSG